jgi:hypothetical protein
MLAADLAAITVAVVWNVASTNFTNSVFFNNTVTLYNTCTFNLLIAFASGANMQFDTTTNGTKIGTAANNKLAFWGANAIVQPTTGIAAATFAANTSLIANDTATWDGYTVGQVVKALRNAGLLA